MSTEFFLVKKKEEVNLESSKTQEENIQQDSIILRKVCTELLLQPIAE